MKLAIDSQISFLALAIASKKLSKTVSETRAKWLQFGTVSETLGIALRKAHLAHPLPFHCETKRKL